MEDIAEWLNMDFESAGRLAMNSGLFRRSIAALTST